MSDYETIWSGKQPLLPDRDTKADNRWGKIPVPDEERDNPKESRKYNKSEKWLRSRALRKHNRVSDLLRNTVEQHCSFNCDAESSCTCEAHLAYRRAMTDLLTPSSKAEGGSQFSVEACSNINSDSTHDEEYKS